MKKLLHITTSLFFFFLYNNAQCQDPSAKKNELVLMAGLIQPVLLQGYNLEMDFYTPKMVFNYSHGFSLDMTNEAGTTVGDIKEQHLAVHIPYSTGFGIGYRLNKYFDVRLEPKMHKFEIYYDDTDRTEAQNQITDYTTFTLGLGAYFRWKPFEKNDTFLKGIFTSTSLRYWQKISSSLDNGELQYTNRITQNTETHKAANIGIANTPFIFNIAIGYCISL